MSLNFLSQLSLQVHKGNFLCSYLIRLSIKNGFSVLYPIALPFVMGKHPSNYLLIIPEHMHPRI